MSLCDLLGLKYRLPVVTTIAMQFSMALVCLQLKKLSRKNAILQPNTKFSSFTCCLLKNKSEISSILPIMPLVPVLYLAIPGMSLAVPNQSQDIPFPYRSALVSFKKKV